jgi:hypothetical protein
MNNRGRFGIYALVWFSVLLPAFGQTSTGTIQGVVQDASGGLIPDVKVSIVNVATNETKQLRTDSSGRYVQPFLLPGTYSVTAERDGFRPVKEENIKLDVSQNRSVDFHMTIGMVTQEVQVSAAAAPIDVNTSAVGQVIDSKRIMDLPLNGRVIFGLAYLTPGVNPTGTPSWGGVPNLAGGRNVTNEAQIDGGTTSTPMSNPGNQMGYLPQVDVVEEFNVEVSTLSAEYGRFGGGIINVATKSGTNKLHGSAYEFVRNDNLDANNFFANRVGQAKGEYTKHQWGGTASGPVTIPRLYNGKDRTFWLFGFEGSPTSSQAVFNGTVPTPEWRAGDFSNLRTASGAPIIIYDPTTGKPDPSNPNRFIHDPFPSNKIPANRVDPVAPNVLKYYPQPNVTPGNPYTNVNNYTLAGTQSSNSWKMDARVDENWTAKWRMFNRVSIGRGTEDPYAPYGNIASPAAEQGPSGQVNVSQDHTFTLSPTLVVNLRYGMSRNHVDIYPYSAGFDLTSLGFPQSVQDIAAPQGPEFPSMSFSGVIGNIGSGGFVRLMQVNMNHSVRGSLTKITSRHTIKTGGEYRKLIVNYLQLGSPGTTWSFSPQWTQGEINTPSPTQGFPLASFLLGVAASGQISINTSAASASSYFAGYIQDDWKVTSKLTLNIGLRYDVERPRTERFDRQAFFVTQDRSPLAGKVPADACPSCGNLMGAMHYVDANNRRQVPADTNNFAPRFGFAHRLDSLTAVRGGYGIAYLPSVMQAAGTVAMPGFQANTNYNGTLDSGRTIHATLSNPFPDGYYYPPGKSAGAATSLGQAIGAENFNAWKNGYVQQWDLNVQRFLPGKFVLEIGYIGNHSIGLVDNDGDRALNQLPASYMAYGAKLTEVVPNPFYGVITDSTLALSKPTVAWGQLQRPYPQYTNVSSTAKPLGNSTYHAMTIKADKRLSNGLSVLAAYTVAKAIDDASSSVGNYGTIAKTKLDVYNLRLERSLSSFDVPQRLVLTYLYELSFGRGKRFLAGLPRGANLLVSGWQVNQVATFQSGLPLIIFAQTNNTGIFTTSQRPNNDGRKARLTGGTESARVARWFDTSVFSQPPSFTFGNTGRILPDTRGPGMRNSDLSILKNVPVRERYRFQYRLEMFNAFNTTQFATPGTTVNTGAFGVISNVQVQPRQIQMALKFLW